MTHEALIEDEDGDAWAVCTVTGLRGLGLDFSVDGTSAPERALRTLDRLCPEALHIAPTWVTWRPET